MLGLFRYLLEQSLSVDNLFVFVLIFKYFKVPIMYQVFYKTSLAFKFCGPYVLSNLYLKDVFYNQSSLVNHGYEKFALFELWTIESGAFIWYCWCSRLSFHINTPRNRHTAGKFIVLCACVFVNLYCFLDCMCFFWNFSAMLLLKRFEVVNLFLAAILLYSSFKVNLLFWEFCGNYLLLFILYYIIRSIVTQNGFLLLQLFSSEDDDTDLSNNFVVKTCQRFIPVTCNVLPLYLFPSYFLVELFFLLVLCMLQD